MAKKNRKIEPSPRGPAHVRLDMTEEDRDFLRVWAAQHGLSMATLARTLLSNLIAEERLRNRDRLR